nr:RNA polymerase sigma factor [Ensifer aridi]
MPIRIESPAYLLPRRAFSFSIAPSPPDICNRRPNYCGLAQRDKISAGVGSRHGNVSRNEASNPRKEAIMPIAETRDFLEHQPLSEHLESFRAIMQAHNRKLYRIARSIVGNNSDAEDVLQEAYVRAFTRLEDFRGDSTLSTWLARIVINESLGRLRKRRRQMKLSEAVRQSHQAEIITFPLNSGSSDPEKTMAQRQILDLVEKATDQLPETYRTVFVLRVIEGLNNEETATLLGLRAETVRTRLHRARHLLKEHLERQIGPVLLDAFPFAGKRCQRLTEAVLARLARRTGG